MHLRAWFDALPAAAAVVDGQGLIRAVNTELCRLLQIRARDWLGCSWLGWVVEGGPYPPALTRPEQFEEDQVLLQYPLGAPLQGRVTRRLLPDRSGDCLLLLFPTQSGPHAESPAQTGPQPSDWFKPLADELQAPLSSLLAALERIPAAQLDPATSQAWHSAQACAGWLQRLLSGVLALAGPEVGPVARPFQLVDLVEETLALLGERAQDRHCRLLALYAPNAPLWVRGCRQSLQTLLLTLLGARLKQQQRGVILLRVGPHESLPDMLRLEVEDDAPLAADQAPPDHPLCENLCQRLGGNLYVRCLGRQGNRLVVEIPMPTVAESQEPEATWPAYLREQELWLLHPNPVQIAGLLDGVRQWFGKVHYAHHFESWAGQGPVLVLMTPEWLTQVGSAEQKAALACLPIVGWSDGGLEAGMALCHWPGDGVICPDTAPALLKAQLSWHLRRLTPPPLAPVSQIMPLASVKPQRRGCGG